MISTRADRKDTHRQRMAEREADRAAAKSDYPVFGRTKTGRVVLLRTAGGFKPSRNDNAGYRRSIWPVGKVAKLGRMA